MEDRFSAIRAAIGTARPNDAVVLLGQVRATGRSPASVPGTPRRARRNRTAQTPPPPPPPPPPPLARAQGHREFVEHWDGDEENPGFMRGWFDDRCTPTARPNPCRAGPAPPRRALSAPALVPACPPACASTHPTPPHPTPHHPRPPPTPPTPHHPRPCPPPHSTPRVEARNALSKLEYLYSLVHLDRSQLPWSGDSAGERSTIWEEPLIEGPPGGGPGGVGGASSSGRAVRR
jgi:hypothetical protein